MKKFVIYFLLFVTASISLYAQTYEGETNKNGQPHGKGKATWAADSVTFECKFKKGLPDNVGVWTKFKNGREYMVYTGQVKVVTDAGGGYKVVPHGSGEAIYPQTGYKCHGPWVDGVARGRWEYPDDNFSLRDLGISVPPNYSGVGGGTNKDATEFFRKAVLQENLENAKIFISKGASVLGNGGSDNPLYDAIKQDDKDLISLIHSTNPDAIRYSQAIHYACAYSDSAMIDFLIDKGASLDLNGYLATWSHVWVRNEPTYEWNSDERFPQTPADVALNYGKYDNMYYIYRKYGKKPTKYGFSRLLVGAIRNDKTDIVSWLLERVGDFFPNWYLNAPEPSYNENYTGMFPLIMALRKNNARLAKRLLQLGADPNIRYADTENSKVLGLGGFDQVSNPLYEAVIRPGMLDVIELMFEKGAVKYADIMKKARSEYKEYFMLKGIQ